MLLYGRDSPCGKLVSALGRPVHPRQPSPHSAMRDTFVQKEPTCDMGPVGTVLVVESWIGLVNRARVCPVHAVNLGGGLGFPTRWAGTSCTLDGRIPFMRSMIRFGTTKSIADLLLEGTDGGEGDDGAVGDLVGRVLVMHAVAGQEGFGRVGRARRGRPRGS